jgi:pimeloyl-ACP methyl ester carboxylesterase
MPFFERAGAPRIYYELDDFTDPWKPKAPCIVLQHAHARSSRFWQGWVPYLSRFYRVLRPDLRARGRSGTDFDFKTGISLAEYIKDFHALLDHLEIDSAHFCGESSSGFLGLALAAERPCRLRTLTLVSAPIYMSEEDKATSLHGHATRAEAMRRMGVRAWLESSNAGRRFPADADPAMLAWTVEEMARTDVEVLVATFALASQMDGTPFLASIGIPVLGIYPSGGVIVKEEHVALLRERVKDVTILRIPTRAHSLQVVMPATCATEVLHFAARHDGIACREA